MRRSVSAVNMQAAKMAPSSGPGSDMGTLPRYSDGEIPNDLDAAHLSFRRSVRQQRSSPSKATGPGAAAAFPVASAHSTFEDAPARRASWELRAKSLHLGRLSAGRDLETSHCHIAAPSKKMTSERQKHTANGALLRCSSDGALFGPPSVEAGDSDDGIRGSESCYRDSTDSACSTAAERSSFGFTCIARQLSHGNLAGSYLCPSPMQMSMDGQRSSFDSHMASDASEASEYAPYTHRDAAPAQRLRKSSEEMVLCAQLSRQSVNSLERESSPDAAQLSESKQQFRTPLQHSPQATSHPLESRCRDVSQVSAFPTSGLAKLAMDADCCGDSGAVDLRTSSGNMCSDEEEDGRQSTALPHKLLGSTRRDSFPLAQHGRPQNGGMQKWNSMSDGQAAVELFWRLNHARQTVDFVRRQIGAFSKLDKATMNPMEALTLLNGLREYESALLDESSAAHGAELDSDMPLLEHAFQTAEACRLAHPEAEWLHVVGLLHGLGKLLAHPAFGSEPQWAICGESFPVGCAHSPLIACPQGFSVNPDRRRRVYNTPTGMFKKHCGLRSVYMSWSAAEYIHMVLQHSSATLPPEALFVLRFQKAHSFQKGAYSELMDAQDRAFLPWLASFQELAVYQRRELPGRLWGAELHEHYACLLSKYHIGPMRW